MKRSFIRRMLQKLACVAQGLLPDHGCFRLRARIYRLAGFEVGNSARICGSAAFVYGNFRVGERVYVGRLVSCYTNPYGRVEIGDDVDIAPHVVLHAGTHLQDNPRRRAGSGSGADIVVGEGTWIGVAAVILYGTHLGRRCIVAPGAVVRGVFPDNVLIGGVPGRVIRSIEAAEPGGALDPM